MSIALQARATSPSEAPAGLRLRIQGSLTTLSSLETHLPFHRQPQRHRQITDCVVAPPRYQK